MASCIIKPSMTWVKTFGLIMALGRSFSTLAVVAPGVVLGGETPEDLVVGVVAVAAAVVVLV